jgi:hypothetical protein
MNDKFESTAAAGTNQSTDVPTVAGTRKPYVSPQLRRLGSVRELTFGSAGGAPDVPGMMGM